MSSTAAGDDDADDDDNNNNNAPPHPLMPRRPDRTTMEGMIWNANHVLDMALSPDTKGIPRKLLSHCKGVALISVVEAGFMVSGSVGTGVILAQTRNPNTGKYEWGPPSAIGMGGLGFGFIVGADIKDVIVLLDDAALVKVLSSNVQLKLGGEMGVAVGPIGREVEASVDFGIDSAGGSAGLALTYTFSKGLFIEAGIQGAILKGRTKENERFYNKQNITPRDILLGRAEEENKGADAPVVVTIPDDKKEMINELHNKLEIMRRGKTRKLTPDEVAKKEEQRKQAEEAGKAAKAEQGDEVEYVDAQARAATEEETTWNDWGNF